MKIDFTNEMVFSFEGPNLCLLGNELDFKKFAESIVDLTNTLKEIDIEILKLDFVNINGEEKDIIFSSKKDGNKLGVFNDRSQLVFELDWRYWERLFKYFVLMSWDKKTYYLNSNENCLDDFELEQKCNFICSSEF